MTTASAVSPRHPFVAALAERDLPALRDALAPDAVLHSAVTATPFRGSDVLTDLYASLFESFEEIRVVDELEGGDTVAFFWEGRIDGRFVAGADHLRLDGDGRVREITIVGRPLSGLATFISSIGARFARRRRGRLVGALLRAAGRPLPAIFALLDPITRWLLRTG